MGEAISVGTHRDRSGEGDPVMDEVRRSLQSMIDAMAAFEPQSAADLTRERRVRDPKVAELLTSLPDALRRAA